MPKLEDYKRILHEILEEADSTTALKALFQPAVKTVVKQKLQNEAAKFRQFELEQKARADELDGMVLDLGTDFGQVTGA